MNRILSILLAVALGLGAVLIFRSRSTLGQRDLASVPTPIEEQKQIVLAFENEAECGAFSPCFYAVVDGASESNPRRASELCAEAVKKLEGLDVPARLPARTRELLARYRDGHRARAEGFRRTAESLLGNPSGGGRSGSTCDSYAIISGVNKAYGLDAMMRGHYVNCQAISEHFAGARPEAGR